jgi:hypothetical protein
LKKGRSSNNDAEKTGHAYTEEKNLEPYV